MFLICVLYKDCVRIFWVLPVMSFNLYGLRGLYFIYFVVGLSDLCLGNVCYGVFTLFGGVLSLEF